MTDDDQPDKSAQPELDQAEAAERAPAPDSSPPPRRRWHQHPVALPIGAAIAGLFLGAGITASLLAPYLPDGEQPVAATAPRAMPPVGIDQAPPPRAWPLPPRGTRHLDDPPPPPPPGAAPALGWGPGAPPPGWGPPQPGWGPPPPGWGPPAPPFGGPPPPPPGWGPGAPPPPPGPWGPPPPPGPPN